MNVANDMTDYTAPPDIIDHIRRPHLPWRDQAQSTECGRDIADVKGLISRDEAHARLKRLGHKRATFSMCLTCLETAERWKAWADDPAEALRREAQNISRRDQARVALLNKELRAIAALIQAHRDEFDGYLTGLEQTISLEAARQARRRR